MKYVLLCASLFSVLIACKSAVEKLEEEEKKISSRDYSITEANAYSDIFLDSMAMEEYIASGMIPDSISGRMRSFYNTRNYQFAWFSSDGLTEQALAFWNLHDYVTTYEKDSAMMDKELQKRMDAYVSDSRLSVNPRGKNFINTELTLTRHFIHYILNNFEKGYVKRKEMERFIPVKKVNAAEYADSLLNKRHNDNKYFEDVHRSYRLLKEQLGRYHAIVESGGWPEVPALKKTLKAGMAAPEIPVIKRRLHIEGDLPVNDTTPRFNDTLELAVKRFQTRLGYTPSGQITPALVKDMNIPAIYRLQQILMNMGRMRWTPADPSTRMIVVNIPEFKLHMYEGKNKAFEMNVVVGKVGHNTMMFSGDLDQVVFSPHWNIPPSIVRNEILPAMERNPGYLASQNMEITGNQGGLPVIRQRPGGQNALGRVKFLFPNSFNIYFHDTPAKGLFSRDKRAFSHGCIRLEEPEKMANYLLREQSEWTPEKISAAMYSGKERFVKLKDPVPVVISYYTAWVDDQGLLNFREDIYKHDEKLVKKMFTTLG